MNVPWLSIVFGILLSALGGACFAATGSAHPTSLIPAAFGLLLIACGATGLAAPKVRMHAMHVAALLGLIGAGAGLGMSLPKIPAVLAETLGTYAAIWEKFAMGVISLVFLALCVKSFIAARRARKAAQS